MSQSSSWAVFSKSKGKEVAPQNTAPTQSTVPKPETHLDAQIARGVSSVSIEDGFSSRSDWRVSPKAPSTSTNQNQSSGKGFGSYRRWNQHRGSRNGSRPEGALSLHTNHQNNGRGRAWTPDSSRRLPDPQLQRSPQHDPLTHFHRFSELASELRIQIWNAYLAEGRLIEFERKLDIGYEERDPRARLDHGYHRICPRSRAPPAILQINREVRGEFMGKYQVIMLERLTMNNRQCAIYYNPDIDILFFGKNSCISTMIHVFQDASRQGISTPRVALDATGDFLNCYSWYTEDGWDVTRSRDVHEGCTLAQALHGVAAEVHHVRTPTITGAPGLKHVYFVQRSTFWDLEAGTISPAVGFRPAVGNGITPGQTRFKKRQVRMIQGVEADVKLTGVGDNDDDNRWTGDNKPSFSFVQLAPRSSGTFASTTPW